MNLCGLAVTIKKGLAIGSGLMAVSGSSLIGFKMVGLWMMKQRIVCSMTDIPKDGTIMTASVKRGFCADNNGSVQVMQSSVLHTYHSIHLIIKGRHKKNEHFMVKLAVSRGASATPALTISKCKNLIFLDALASLDFKL